MVVMQKTVYLLQTKSYREKKFDENIGSTREFDILTKRCIIEVKSKKECHLLNQFIAQSLYAKKIINFFWFCTKYVRWL